MARVVFTCSTDDGHPSDMKMAALLSKHGLQGTFFIPIRNRDGLDVLAREQIREIGQGFEIGSHTYDHCYLKNVNLNEACSQIINGKNQLENMLGRHVVGFCYPGGKYRQDHVKAVMAAGFLYARTTTNLRFDVGDNSFEMPTTLQFYPHQRAVYVSNFITGGECSKRQIGLRLAVKNSNWIDRLYGFFEYSCRQGGVFHLWGHSWEIDSLGAWNELDRFLGYVATNVAMQDRLTNEQLAARFFWPGHA